MWLTSAYVVCIHSQQQPDKMTAGVLGVLLLLDLEKAVSELCEAIWCLWMH